MGALRGGPGPGPRPTPGSAGWDAWALMIPRSRTPVTQTDPGSCAFGQKPLTVTDAGEQGVSREGCPVQRRSLGGGGGPRNRGGHGAACASRAQGKSPRELAD